MRRKEGRKESKRFEGDGGDEMLVNKGGSFEMRGRRKEEGVLYVLPPVNQWMISSEY